MLENINAQTLNTFDLYILLFFAVIVLLCLFVLYRRIFALLFCIYVSYLIAIFAPFDFFKNNVSYCFMGLIIILFLIFSRFNIFISQTAWIIKRFIYSIIFGILNAGLFLSLLILLLPLNWLSKFSGTSLNLLGSDVARFIWITLPIFLILIFNKKRKGPGRPSIT